MSSRSIFTAHERVACTPPVFSWWRILKHMIKESSISMLFVFSMLIEPDIVNVVFHYEDAPSAGSYLQKAWVLNLNLSLWTIYQVKVFRDSLKLKKKKQLNNCMPHEPQRHLIAFETCWSDINGKECKRNTRDLMVNKQEREGTMKNNHLVNPLVKWIGASQFSFVVKCEWGISHPAVCTFIVCSADKSCKDPVHRQSQTSHTSTSVSDIIFPQRWYSRRYVWWAF